MDTFANSSWYFMRYCDPKNNKKIFDSKKAEYWCPVDIYIGGAEHACMHLIYSRFYTKFLRDLGVISFDEPAIKLLHQGMINGSDGEKMSKSKGNGVEPLETMKKYGVDTTRLFLVSVAAPEKGFDWNDKGINGSSRLIKKIFDLYSNVKIGEDSAEVLSLLNKVIRDSGKMIDNFDYRPVTIQLKELFELLGEQATVSKDTLEKSLKLLYPFCPHIAEELWEQLGNNEFISISEWPKCDESKILKKGQTNGDLTTQIIAKIKEIIKDDIEKIFIYAMPFEMNKINSGEIEKDIGKSVRVFAVNDKDKHDPANKAKKAKPGMPSIYLE